MQEARNPWAVRQPSPSGCQLRVPTSVGDHMGTARLGRKLPQCRSINSPVRREDDHDADIRWRHLPDNETARRFADLLIREFVSNGRYAVPPRACLEIKDDAGSVLLSIPFPQIA